MILVDLALAFPWPWLDRYPWPWLDLFLTLPRPCLDLALTFIDLALTLPWPFLDLALPQIECPSNIVFVVRVGVGVQSQPQLRLFYAEFWVLLKWDVMRNTSLAVPGALPNRLQCMQNSKCPLGSPKMADGVWKGVHPLVFGCTRQLSQNKFFDPSTPSIRKGRNREETKGKKVWKIMKFIVATVVIASQPPERRPTAMPTTRFTGV